MILRPSSPTNKNVEKALPELSAHRASSPQVINEVISEAIANAADAATPRRKFHPKPPKPWITPVFLALREETIKARKKFQLTHNLYDKKVLSALELEYQTLIQAPYNYE